MAYYRIFIACCKFGLAFLGVLILQACAISHQPVPIDARLDQREQQLVAIEHWAFSGKLGVKAPSDSGSLYITWRQDKQDFVIDLQGPLGQGSAKMVSVNNEVSLEHDGEHYRSQSAELLIFERFGWQLPVDQLQYWVRALPAPSDEVERQLERDEQGLLLAQHQSDWQIEYSQYHWVGDQALPGKIRAESLSLGVKLTLVISQWELGAKK